MSPTEFIRMLTRLLGRIADPTSKIKHVYIYTEDACYHITESNVLESR